MLASLDRHFYGSKAAQKAEVDFFLMDRHLERSRCPFPMFGSVVSGKYYHRPVFFLFFLLLPIWLCELNLTRDVSFFVRQLIEYSQIPHVCGKTFFSRRMDWFVILDLGGQIYRKKGK